jgi:Cytochrome c7 and related cytochrome c
VVSPASRQARAISTLEARDTPHEELSAMNRSDPDHSLRAHTILVLALALLPIGLSACTGEQGPPGPQGPPGNPSGNGPTNTVLQQGDTPPGVQLAILSVQGASGLDGSFQVGDHLKVTFTVKKNDGTSWMLSEMSSARFLFSGPSFNYQRVLDQVSDVATASTANSDGSFTYTFATGIPATYLAPYNTTSPGSDAGDLSGQNLLAGTYTLGGYFSWKFTVDGASATDAGNAEKDVLFGGATDIEAREAVTQANCNQCHQTLQAHGGARRDVKLCILCHTAGSTDSSTPQVSINFKVMVHKIHNAAHLPSVLGVTTKPDGSRDYTATPMPYVVGGDDFSHVNFPVWPNAQIPLPRDSGYSALPASAQAQEDSMREGAANCIVCHGDPDGPGPLTAPAQGDLYKAQPSRDACGACHDDVIWGQPYTANMQTMGAQANDSNCLLCHAPSGSPIAVQDAHTHPLSNPTFNPGLDIAITNLAEAGTNNGDGTIDPGEKIAITLTIQDGSGMPVLPSSLSSMSAVLSGPSSNYNILLNTSIPTAALTGSQPFMIHVPQSVLYEFVGKSTAALDVFTTALTPHWNVAGALTTVQVRTATGGSSTLSAAAPAVQNFLDVASAAAFARNDFIVIDDGVAGKEEYLKIQWVDGTRLWFSSPYTTNYAPGVVFAHASGATVKQVTLTSKIEGTDYTLNTATGQITELVEFGAGDAVVVSYTTDFVMPAVYPQALNASPDLDETWGKWTQKPIAAGTYSLGVWGQQNLTLTANGESNSYRNTSVTNRKDFLVAGATTLEPYGLISSSDNCAACHQDITFHGGGRRGYDACLLCHGTAGSEDRPQYVAANAPPTTGVTVNFRTMLHKIHRGSDLANAATYTIVGFGSGAYPDNFSPATYSDVVFPAMPDGVDNCAKCHGDSNTAWQVPADRDHPTDQGLPVRTWRAVCGSCHDDAAASAHIDTQTSPSGAEACNVCHGTSGDWAVARVHKTY